MNEKRNKNILDVKERKIEMIVFVTKLKINTTTSCKNEYNKRYIHKECNDCSKNY